MKCRHKTENLLKELLDFDLYSELGTGKEDKAEAIKLYAEYAIDFITQAIQYALVYALTAIDLQMSTE